MHMQVHEEWQLELTSAKNMSQTRKSHHWWQPFFAYIKLDG